MARRIWLSGTDTAERWYEIRQQLDSASGAGPWKDANAFLIRRMETRYLQPIQTMRRYLPMQGAGFAIVSLQCALIEFLAALVEGRHYVASKSHPDWDNYAYHDSSRLFVRFLRKEEPFCQWLTTNAQGKDFYQNVRCGLLHEAMTKGRWLINVSGKCGLDVAGGVVYRDTLQGGIETWLRQYAVRIASDAALREAFIRKLNHIAG